jgi:hypothetical protein
MKSITKVLQPKYYKALGELKGASDGRYRTESIFFLIFGMALVRLNHFVLNSFYVWNLSTLHNWYVGVLSTETT